MYTFPVFSTVKKTSGIILVIIAFLFAGQTSAQVEVNEIGQPVTNYPNLTVAFLAISNGVHTGKLQIKITGNVNQPSTAVLNASGAGLANYTTIDFIPDLLLGTPPVIQGDINGPLILLNGTDSLSMGAFKAGEAFFLDIVNINAGALASAVEFTNGASVNTIKFTRMLSSGQGATSGIVEFSDGDNNENNIEDCIITSSASGNATNGITSISPTGINTANRIANCIISDWFNQSLATNGILLGNGNSQWTIENNRFFQTSPRSFTVGNEHTIARIESGSGYMIEGNIMGYTNSSGTGNYMLSGATSSTKFFGIYMLGLGNMITSRIAGNTIDGFDIVTTAGTTAGKGVFAAIALGDTSPETTAIEILSNKIGLVSPSESLKISSNAAVSAAFGIYVLTNGNIDVVSNEIIDIAHINENASVGSSRFTLIKTNTAASSVVNIEDNDIGSLFGVPKIISDGSVNIGNNGFLRGIDAQGGTISIGANVLGGFLSADTSALTSFGISAQSDQSISIAFNTVSNLTAQNKGDLIIDSNPVGLAGIISSTPTQNTVFNNRIDILTLNNQTSDGGLIGVSLQDGNTNSSCNDNIVSRLNTDLVSSFRRVAGIIHDGGNFILYNNMISMDTDTQGTLLGLAVTGGSSRGIYHNSVFLGKENLSNNISAGFFTAMPDTEFLNNLIWVDRSTGAGASGKNYGVYYGAPSAGTRSDYNTIIWRGTNSFLGNYNGTDIANINDWKAANVLFGRYTWTVPPSVTLGFSQVFADASEGDLHIISSSAEWLFNGKGIFLSAAPDDIDGDLRSSAVEYLADIGADQFMPSTDPPSAVLSSGSIGPGTTAVYTYAEKVVAVLEFEPTAAIYPNIINVQYFSGELPPSVELLTSHAFSYWRITPDIPVSITYKITLDFGEHEIGNIPASSANSILLQFDEAPIVWDIYNEGVGPLESVRSWNAYPGFTKQMTVSGLTKFGPYTLGNQDEPLPVTLVRFTAKSEERGVLLEWATASEVNNDFFTVERSTNAEEFETVGTVKGAGNSSSEIVYSLLDNNPYSGISYYRLKQTDFDGISTFSEIISVNSVKASEISLYPNPANTVCTLNLSSRPKGVYTFTIQDFLGRVVKTEALTYNGDSALYQINLNGIAAGSYIFSVSGEGESNNGKLIIN